MNEDTRAYKEQLYPKCENKNINILVNKIIEKVQNNKSIEEELELLKEVKWEYKAKDNELTASVYDAYKLYNVINNLIQIDKNDKKITEEFFNDSEDDVKELLRNICIGQANLNTCC